MIGVNDMGKQVRSESERFSFIGRLVDVCQSPDSGEVVLIISTDNPEIKIKLIQLLKGRTHLFKICGFTIDDKH